MSDPQSSSAPRRGGFSTIVALVLAAALAAGAAWQFGWLGPRYAVEPEKPEPLYFKLGPELIVNFEGGGRARYLQLGIELMTYDKEALPALELHAPVLRNNLILLLSDKTYEELITREGKERLAAAALEVVRQAMTERYGSPVVETVYFTSFVMQ
ncbi:MAG TPA: flagellar basal body-associated FliL family protein [Gammaproteobacteria bacterium]